MNVRYMIYDTATGRARCTGSCLPEDMDSQILLPGEAILPCAPHMRSATHCVDVGSLSFQENPNVAVYDKTTCAIARTVRCFRGDVAKMANPNENQAAVECALGVSKDLYVVDVSAKQPSPILAAVPVSLAQN